MAGSAAQGEGAPAPRRGLPPPLDSLPQRGRLACLPSLAPENSPLCKSNMPLLSPLLQEDIFEWHFVIRGAWDSEFEVCRVLRGSAGGLRPAVKGFCAAVQHWLLALELRVVQPTCWQGLAPKAAAARVPAPPLLPPPTLLHAFPFAVMPVLQGGIYHGRILMPAEYPFKPPAFVMLTPSGRFETGVKIWCVAAAAAARLANACIACGPSRTHFGMARQGL